MIGTGATAARVRARAVRLLVVLALAVVVAGMLPPAAVIVRTDPAVQARAERLVTQAGGHIERRLAVISGFSATMTRPALTRLRRMAE